MKFSRQVDAITDLNLADTASLKDGRRKMKPKKKIP